MALRLSGLQTAQHLCLMALRLSDLQTAQHLCLMALRLSGLQTAQHLCLMALRLSGLRMAPRRRPDKARAPPSGNQGHSACHNPPRIRPPMPRRSINAAT